MRHIRLWGARESDRCTQVICGLFAVISVIGVLSSKSEAGNRPKRTRAEVEALIAKVGATQPDWWESTPLKCPDTLDLNWSLKPTGNWDNQKNVGQYIWDVINPNPGRWKEGIKLVHHLMLRNKDDQAKLARSMQTLGTMFHNFTQDWPRAVFWYRMSMKYGQTVDPAHMANCFWQMGCEEMAREILNRFTTDYTRNGVIIKLWADMGELDKALGLAEQKARSGNPNIAYLAAGNACRQAGRITDALTYYRKAAEATAPGKPNNDFTRARAQARENIEVIHTFELLDLKQMPEGRYTGTSTAFNGPLTVQVQVSHGRIVSIRVTQHQEKQFYSAMTETPEKIIAQQSLKNIDACTGATITSEAIINATAKALARTGQ